MAMECGTCRSGRTGSAPRRETFGYARGREEGQGLRGKMRQPLRGEKRVRRDAARPHCIQKGSQVSADFEKRGNLNQLACEVA